MINGHAACRALPTSNPCQYGEHRPHLLGLRSPPASDKVRGLNKWRGAGIRLTYSCVHFAPYMVVSCVFLQVRRDAVVHSNYMAVGGRTRTVFTASWLDFSKNACDTPRAAGGQQIAARARAIPYSMLQSPNL